LSGAVTVPQFLPIRAQKAASVSAIQPQTLLAPQVWGAVHVPHEATVREMPQLSFAVTPPQFLPSREQNAPSLSVVQLHTFGVPLPPHVDGEVHVPHEATVRPDPQLSLAVTPAQFFPSLEQNAVSVSVVHPHTFAVPPPPHVAPVPAQVPHDATVRVEPQLSSPVTFPQFLPRRAQNAASLSAAHPHTFAVPPPPQVAGAVHAPHEPTARLAPQLSLAVTLPQLFPRRVQNAASVSAMQPHTFAFPPPPHVAGAVHVPQEPTVRLAPQLSVPLTFPQFLIMRPQKTASVSPVHPHKLLVLHTSGAVHVPHEGAVRPLPQLSVAVTLPHCLPSRVQKAGSVSAVHPHTFAVPPPPHVMPVPAHTPHEATVREPPHLSVPNTLSQFLPSLAQSSALVSAVHPHTFAVPPPPHVTPVPAHVPHDATVRDTPQLSA
jgi:hypothetical protein